MSTKRAHPAEITCQRLVRHEDQWAMRLTREELDAFLIVRRALLRIGDEDEQAADKQGNEGGEMAQRSVGPGTVRRGDVLHPAGDRPGIVVQAVHYPEDRSTHVTLKDGRMLDLPWGAMVKVERDEARALITGKHPRRDGATAPLHD